MAISRTPAAVITVVARTWRNNAPNAVAVPRASVSFDKGPGEYRKTDRRWIVDLLALAQEVDEFLARHAQLLAAGLVECREEFVSRHVNYLHVEHLEIDDCHCDLTLFVLPRNGTQGS
jgi:hypothetical protein